MNLDERYLIWQLVAVKRAYTVSWLDDAFLKGVHGSLASVWPAAAFCVLDVERGYGNTTLTDSLFNRDRRLIVSPRLKDFLVRSAGPDVEYWPIRIMDLSGRILGEPYFFVHFVNLPDCLDLEASGAVRSRILPALAEKVERLIFKSDPERALTRPSTFAGVTLVRWPLATALADEGFSGFRLMGLFDYGITGDLPPDPRRHAVDALCARLGNKKK